jgi:hypothetical protein
MPEIRSSKAARSMNPRWTNVILYGINGDTGAYVAVVKLACVKNPKYAVMIFMDKLVTLMKYRRIVKHQNKMPTES